MGKQIYIAGPLFTEAEREWNYNLKEILLSKLRDQFYFFLPQEHSGENVRLLNRHAIHIYKRNAYQIKASDILIAILDGPSVDDGTAWEIGYFRALKPEAPIIGIRTDFRSSGEVPGEDLNIMILYSIDSRTRTIPELLEERYWKS